MQECAQTSELMSGIGSLFCGVRKGNCAPYWSELCFLILFWARGFFPSTWTCASMLLLNQMILAPGRSRQSRRDEENEPSITLQTDCLSLCNQVSEHSDWCLREPYGDEIEYLLCEEPSDLTSPEWDRPPVPWSSLSLSVFVMDSRYVWESKASCDRLKVLEVSVGSVQTRGKWIHSIVVKQSCFPNHWKCLQMCRQILHLKSHLSTEVS